MKTCTKCGVAKPEAAYYQQSKGKGGITAACKECMKSAVRKHRRLSDDVRVYDRSRGSRASAESLSAYRAKHPDAYRAHNAVSNGLRDGRLSKEPCLFCGEARVHGHHRDYSRPLDVIWLCAKCHHRLHANFPETAAHEPKRRNAA